MDNLSQTLTDAGLSSKEASVYLTLLKIKTGTAYKISKISRIKKPTTYVILESLREKGYVLKTPSKRGTVYTAKSPDELVHNVEQKLNNIIQILPHLKNIFKGDKHNINAYYYEGIDGVRNILSYRINEIKDTEIIGFFAKLEDPNEIIFKVTQEWASKFLKNNVSIRGITPDFGIVKELSKKNKEVYQNIKFIDRKKYSSNISIDCVHGFVRIVDLKNLNGVIIENKEVSDTIRQIFEMIWSNLK